MAKEPKKEKKVKLTLKQAKFLKLYFETGNATRSALEVYDTDDYGVAGNIASENLKKLQAPIKTLMEAKGLSVGRLMEVLDDGLKANRTLSAKVIYQGKQGEATTKTDDFIEVPDHAVRHKFLDTASKWLGIDKAQTLIQQNIQVNLTDEQLETKLEALTNSLTK